MVKHLLKFIPEHKVYVEPFGGGAQLLFAKPRSRIEVYNDIDSGLVNFFRVFRDEEKFWKLLNLLQLTPYSREEYYYCSANWRSEQDDVEKARMWFVALRQAFTGKIGGGWSISKNIDWQSVLELFPILHKRFKGVYIEYLPAIECMKKWDTEETFFYCDPPYPLQTRKGKIYDYEMTDDQHKELIDFIQKLKGQIIISTYQNEIYEVLARNGWKKLTFDAACHSQPGKQKPKKDRRTETVYISPKAIRQGILIK